MPRLSHIAVFFLTLTRTRLPRQLKEKRTSGDVKTKSAFRASIARGLQDANESRIQTSQKLRDALGLGE